MNRESIQGEKPYLEGFLKWEEKKNGFFMLCVKGSKSESSRVARETLWEDKATAEGVEVL